MMANLKFTFEIHHGGHFMWNLDLVYLDGSVSIIDEVDPDRLSLYEIQDICAELGAPSTSTFHYLIPGGNLEQGLMVINGDDDVLNMCDIHVAWPSDRIILYVDGGEEPLAIEEPIVIEEVGGQDGDDEHKVGQNDGDMHEVGQNDDDVHDVHEGGNVDAKGDGGQDCPDFDWLEEGFKGPDFDDDVFGNLDDGRSTHDGVSDSVASHRPTTAKNDKEVAIRSSAIENECVEEGEWIDPPIEDDMESLVGSNDDQPALAAAKEPVFNVQTDMRKPMLMKGMKFPNSKVFREALRKYGIRKPVDIKFKLNEKKKISVYCINEYGWSCYASQLLGELTFKIKTFNPECTCPRSFKHTQVTASYVAKKFVQYFDQNPNWKVAGVQHHVKEWWCCCYEV